MDLSDTMKNLVMKNMQQQQQQVEMQSSGPSGPPGYPGPGYISEKLYLLLQIYLQNKSWNPTVELLQCFNELKDSSMLPNGNYLQLVANRVTLDNQGRLILRENGKIILPYEHFANAIMLKHMNGPHGMHLGVDATIRAVMESYTVGRENFGMEKDFIVEVVQNCPNPACRFYKNQMDQLTHKSLQHLSSQAAAAAAFHAAAAESAAGSMQHGGGGFPQELASVFPPVSPAPTPSSVGSAVDLTERVAVALGRPMQQGPGGQGPIQIPQQGNVGGNNLPPPSAPAVNLEADQSDKLAEFLRANFDTLEGLPGAKDFLALQNGVWPLFETDKRPVATEGQEKIVRTFSEIMKNMARMKTCVRPSMCKPYGKQSETLQKTLVDTIQLVQSVRSFLPPPHITITSWKEEEHKHRYGDNSNLPYRSLSRPGSKSSLRTLGKMSMSGAAGGGGGGGDASAQHQSVLPPLPALLAENYHHLVRAKSKYE